jgi:hypothetical protein
MARRLDPSNSQGGSLQLNSGTGSAAVSHDSHAAARSDRFDIVSSRPADEGGPLLSRFKQEDHARNTAHQQQFTSSGRPIRAATYLQDAYLLGEEEEDVKRERADVASASVQPPSIAAGIASPSSTHFQFPPIKRKYKQIRPAPTLVVQQTMAPTLDITPIDLPVPRKARSAMPERRARSSRAAYNALKQAAHGTLPLGGKKPALGVMHGAVASRFEGQESDRCVESCALILGCAHFFFIRALMLIHPHIQISDNLENVCH